MTTPNKIRLMFWVFFSGLCAAAYSESREEAWIALYWFLSLLVLSNWGKEERHK